MSLFLLRMGLRSRKLRRVTESRKMSTARSDRERTGSKVQRSKNTYVGAVCCWENEGKSKRRTGQWRRSIGGDFPSPSILPRWWISMRTDDKKKTIRDDGWENVRRSEERTFSVRSRTIDPDEENANVLQRWRIEHDQSRSPDVARIEGWSCAAARSRGHPVNWQTTPERPPNYQPSHPALLRLRVLLNSLSLTLVCRCALLLPPNRLAMALRYSPPLQVFEQLAPTRGPATLANFPWI